MSQSSTLENFTDDQLRAELKRRDDERAAEAEQRKQQRISDLRFYLTTSAGRELLGMLLPEHSRNTCNDKNPNVDRCTRCTVLDALANEDWEVMLRLRAELG